MAKKDDIGKLIEAIAFAAHKHKDQRRKDKAASPYINHPITLANILINEVGITDCNILVAAILHDTIEDTDTDEDELIKTFGDKIASIVMEVTDDMTMTRDQRKNKQVEKAATISYEAKLVKLADKISNLRDIVVNPPIGWGLERRQQYFDWAKKVIDQLRGSHLKLEELFDEVYQKKPKS